MTHETHLKQRTVAMALPYFLAVLVSSCGEVKKSSSTRTSAELEAKEVEAANANSKAQVAPRDKVVGDIASAFQSMKFHNGVYDIKVKIGFIECGGEFPIKFRMPDAESSTPLDFMGAKLDCLGMTVPLDDILKMLMPMVNSAEKLAPGVQPLVLANAGGLIGLTRLGPLTMAPSYPIMPDILSSDLTLLKSLNASTAVKLANDLGTSESGTALLQVKQVKGPYQTASGMAFPKTTIWEVSNSGFKKLLLGPHVLSTLEVGLNMEPLAVPRLAFSLAVTEDGKVAFQSILDNNPNPPGFLTFLVDRIKLLKDSPLMANLTLEFSAEMVRFLDASEEMKLK